VNPTTLKHYLHRFENLSRNRHAVHGAAPHKPILLLAILQEIDARRITGNLVTLTPELVAAFHAFWQALVPPDSRWKDRMSYPFRYLGRDGFWELVKNGEPVTIRTPYEPTLNQLAALCDGGRFADDLWPLLCEDQSRAIFQNHLRRTYFEERVVPAAENRAAAYLSSHVAKLRLQAKAQFRLRPLVRETQTDGYFVRSRLFPAVVKEAYGNRCCVCGLAAQMGESRLVQGAHILPFAEFHNDDMRNGLSLCRNHHWGFDNGAWSLKDDGEILVSEKLTASAAYVTAETILRPEEVQYHPDPAALGWHRQRWGFDVV
jgi:putative restriction endonuclease